MGTITLYFPSNPDLFSESLSGTNYYWSADYGFIQLDPLIKMVGDHSIKCYSSVYNYYVGCSLNFYSLEGAEPFNAVRTNCKINFLTVADSGMTGTFYIILKDANNRTASKTYGVNPVGTAESKSWTVNNNTEWQVESGFDWTKIVGFLIYGDQVSNKGGAFWIDQPYFTWEEETGIVTIASKPTGIQNNIMHIPSGIYPFQTPSQIELPVGTDFLVEMATTDSDGNAFDHWEDLAPEDYWYNQTDRVITVETGAKTVTAIYGTEVTNPTLIIDSYDLNMTNYPANQGVKFVFGGIEDYHNVPFGARVGRGTYTFVAIETADRILDHWVLPDGSTSTEKYVTWNIQSDTRLQMIWKVTGTIQTNSLIYAIAGIGAISIGAVAIKLIKDRKKPKSIKT